MLTRIDVHGDIDECKFSPVYGKIGAYCVCVQSIVRRHSRLASYVSELNLQITKRSFYGKVFSPLSISVSQTLAFEVPLLSESTSKFVAALAALNLP